MYKVYDIELTKEVIASLSFIALKCGITFPNREQFNNIIYKLYNYIKDDIVYEDGIVITEELKEKINTFKTIYNSLPNPEMGESETLLGRVNSYQSSPTFPLMEAEVEAVSEEEGYTCPFKFYPEKTGSGYIYIGCYFYRLSDGYKTNNIIYPLTSPPTNCLYFKIRIIAMTSYYRAYIDFYGENDELLKTIYQNYSTIYKPTTYPTWNLYHVYGTTTALDVYREYNYNFTINEENVINIDTNSLVINDKYYSSNIIFGKDEEPITIYTLLDKLLNGEFFGFKYGILESYLGQTCQYDKNIFKFITITANEDKTAYTGYISTYPLYATNTSNELGLWFLNTSDTIPVKVFKSNNGQVWSEITSSISSSLPYTTDAIIVKSTALTYAGEDIIYSNYPIYYSLVGSNFETRKLLEIENEEDILNDEGIPYALEEDNTFKLYRNSDEDFTLDLLPLGASFYFGKHKIEDSPRFKIIFRPLDYTNNINTAYGNDTWLPKDSVYCDTIHIIDALAYHSYKNYSKLEMMYEYSHLSRWLNSDAPEGKWWSSINEYDSEPIEANMDTSIYSKGYEFGHRAGFLYNFAEEEKALLQPFNGWSVYKGTKVLFIDSSEAPSSSAKAYRPKIFKACGSSTVGVLRPYYVNELKYHKHSDISSKCTTKKNDFISTYTANWFWCRNKGTNNGQYSDFTVSGTVAYYGNAIKPAICLPKDIKIKREPDEYGIFSLDLPIPETIDVDLKYDIERDIRQNTEEIFETTLNILEDNITYFDIERAIGISNIESFNIERIININSLNSYPLIRNISSPIEVKYPTVREVNYFYNFRFPIELRTIRDINLSYPLVRDVIKEYFINESFNTIRYVTKNEVRVFPTERNVLGWVNKDYYTLRYVQENIDELFETALEIILHQDFKYPLIRDIREDIVNIYDTRRKTCEDKEFNFPTSREIYRAEIINYETKRQVRKNIEKDYTIFRYIQSEEKVNYDLLRFICEPTILKFSTNRYITNKSINKYPIIRSIKKEEAIALTYDIFREVLENTNFIAKTIRYIKENYSDNIDTCRDIVEDFSIINKNIMRKVVVNMDNDYPTKRFITRDDDKYVSKANLILYTQLLKEQIADYIDLKIKEEFSKRNL